MILAMYLYLLHIFLTLQKKSVKILWKLYVDFKLSTRDIEELTQSSWSKSSILRALRKHKIIKNIHKFLKTGGNNENTH